MIDPRRAFCTLVAVLAIAWPSARAWSGQREGDGDDKKPSLALKANPPVGFSPLRVRVVVDVKGGANDYADFYCPSIEWDWGDGTVSENSSDCDPYEAGKSAIPRRFSAEHIYRQAGAFKLVFRLKQKNKTIAATRGNVQVRAGLREEFGG
jgi:hypothetical protein